MCRRNIEPPGSLSVASVAKPERMHHALLFTGWVLPFHKMSMHHANLFTGWVPGRVPLHCLCVSQWGWWRHHQPVQRHALSCQAGRARWLCAADRESGPHWDMQQVQPAMMLCTVPHNIHAHHCTLPVTCHTTSLWLLVHVSGRFSVTLLTPSSFVMFTQMAVQTADGSN